MLHLHVTETGGWRGAQRGHADGDFLAFLSPHLHLREDGSGVPTTTPRFGLCWKDSQDSACGQIMTKIYYRERVQSRINEGVFWKH